MLTFWSTNDRSKSQLAIVTCNACAKNDRILFLKRLLLIVQVKKSSTSRAVARSENPGGHVILGGDNVPPMVDIGLTDLPKSGRAPPLATGLL